MSERPFMQLYVSDFVGDTLLLSTEHIGAYLLLLIALWNAHGSLPADEIKLARATRMTVKKWRRVAVDLMPFFEVEEGTLTHHRLTKELQKSEAQSNSRAIAGAKGGTANALKYNNPREAIASAGLKHARASPKPYREKALPLSKDSGENPETITLDRYAGNEADLFAACEALRGVKVPEYLQRFPFPAHIVEQARLVGPIDSEHDAA